MRIYSFFCGGCSSEPTEGLLGRLAVTCGHVAGRGGRGIGKCVGRGGGCVSACTGVMFWIIGNLVGVVLGRGVFFNGGLFNIVVFGVPVCVICVLLGVHVCEGDFLFVGLLVFLGEGRIVGGALPSAGRVLMRSRRARAASNLAFPGLTHLPLFFRDSAYDCGASLVGLSVSSGWGL